MVLIRFLTHLSILDKLVEDPDRFTWQELALCAGDEVSNFFDKYDSNKVIATQIDARCFVCPVAKLCLQDGIDKKEHGVRGGVYLNGKGGIDKAKNEHKTEEDWQKLASIIAADSI